MSPSYRLEQLETCAQPRNQEDEVPRAKEPGRERVEGIAADAQRLAEQG